MLTSLNEYEPLLPDNWLDKDLDELANLAPVQPIHLPVFEQKQLHVSIKRDDLLDFRLGGNKLYKLYFHLQEIKNAPQKWPVISFGGAHSNHIYALAAACQQFKIPCIGIIRGEEPLQLSDTLQDARRFGMQLKFISREEYRHKDSEIFKAFLHKTYGDHFFVSEGGGGVNGVKGCMSLARGVLNSVEEKPDVIVHACGTGTSLAGIVCGLALSPIQGVNVLGISVLKGYESLEDDVSEYIDELAPNASGWEVNSEFHCGGYAKYPDFLAQFVEEFENQTQVPLDPVYTSKVMYGLVKLAEQNGFSPGARIVVVHSGGLQGRRGMNLS